MQYGLIGERLSHSYSKPIHERIGGYPYELCPLSKEEFPEFMKRKEFLGINVTIPYKKAVLPYLSWIDTKAEQIGSVNTIVNRNGKLFGYNTDYYGLLYTIQKNHIPIQGKKVLVLGNGGVALTVFSILKEQGAKKFYVVKPKKEPNVLTYEEAARDHADADFIINTSPVGMYPNIDASPIDLTPYHSLCAVLDLIFNPLKTKFILQAESMGIPAFHGLEMLVAQAKYAAEYFTDTTISDDIIEPVLQELMNQLNL